MQFINNRRAMAQSQSGFTLIELLVVIAILGILAGVVVFAVGGVTENGQASACKLEARTVKTAVQAYRAKNSAYPAAIGDLTTNGAWLENAPELVTLTFIAGPPVGKPTLAWTDNAACDGNSAVGTVAAISGLNATP